MVVICFPIRFEIPLRHQVFEHVRRQKLIAQPALVAMGIAVSDRLPGTITAFGSQIAMPTTVSTGR